MRKLALLQVADTGPLESLVVMLQTAGYECLTPSNALHRKLQDIGCDTVISIKHLVDNWGYSPPILLPRANIRDMQKIDLFVDVKAYRNGPKLEKVWPHLERRILWYRINGGEPEVTPHGDEINFPYPILTPNQWYGTPGPWQDQQYTFWPWFYRWEEFSPKDIDELQWPKTEAPICLTHNIRGWGYQRLIEPCRSLGVKFHGVNSPDGLIQNRNLPQVLQRAQALVHLKSSDAPGYSLYEAIAARCPLIVPNLLIKRNLMGKLLIPNQTCLTFGDYSIGLTDALVEKFSTEISEHLRHLQQNPRLGKVLTENLAEQLQREMWSPYNPRDINSFSQFIQRVVA